jgi:hypothetical protein
MELDSVINQFIYEGGGPDAFDPETEEDNYAELRQLILEVESGGDERRMAVINPGYIDQLARRYLGLPAQPGTITLI